MKNKIFYMIVILILCITNVYAFIRYNSSDIGFVPSNSNWQVDNINDAINDLYNSCNGTNKNNSIDFLNTSANVWINTNLSKLNITENSFIAESTTDNKNNSIIYPISDIYINENSKLSLNGKISITAITGKFSATRYSYATISIFADGGWNVITTLNGSASSGDTYGETEVNEVFDLGSFSGKDVKYIKISELYDSGTSTSTKLSLDTFKIE